MCLLDAEGDSEQSELRTLQTDMSTKLTELHQHVRIHCSVAVSKILAFLPRDALLSAVYAVVVCLCVCLSVCLCVCLSHSGIVSKRLNVGSRKQRRTIAP